MRHGNIAMSTYRELYVKRYGSEPLPTGAVGFTILKDLIRRIGLERTLILLRQYLSMNGRNDYYKNSGHSLKVFSEPRVLETLNATAGPTKKDTATRAGVEISVDTRCPHCKRWFSLKCNSLEVERVVLVTPCSACAF